MKYDTAISDAFGGIEDVTPKNEVSVVEPPAQTTVVPYQSSEESAFDSAANTISDLITKGEDALENLKDIATAEESPRAFEVLNTMIGTLSDLSMKLVELEERKVKLKKLKKEVNEDEPSGGQITNNAQSVTNNIVFVGTKTELQERLKQLNNGS